MESDKIVSLFHDKKFLKKFSNLKDENEAIELLKSNGVEITYEEYDKLYTLCDEYVNNGMKVSDKELDMVAAGLNINKDIIISFKEAMEFRF
jgi:hypothetical protein